TQAFEKRYDEEPGYHAAGGYVAGLILQHAIEKAGSVDTKAVAKVLDNMDVMTFFGRIKFGSGDEHGLQVGHEMLLAQWQQGDNDKLVKQLIYPKSARTAPALHPLDKF